MTTTVEPPRQQPPAPPQPPPAPARVRRAVTAWAARRRPRSAPVEGAQPMWMRMLRAVSAGVAVLTLWLLFYAIVLTPLQEHHDQGILYGQLRSDLANQTAPIGGAIAPGRAVALMSMPSIGIKRTVVVEGTAAGDLEAGPGHYRTSVLPGQAGLSVIYGRAQLFGAPFGAIGSARPKDTITFKTGEGTSIYRVTQVVHPGQHAPPAASNSLVLITATSSGWRSGWAPSQVVYVFASLDSKPFAADSGQYAQVPGSEQPMHADKSALYVLVLWLPLLMAAVLAVLWASVRWGRWQAYVLGVPVLLATLWGASEAVVRLLPNLV